MNMLFMEDICLFSCRSATSRAAFVPTCLLRIAEQTLDRDRFQSAEEAKEFGLIDEVIEKRPEPEQV
jgi:ATP-dependent protease ClpP protease subunit